MFTLQTLPACEPDDYTDSVGQVSGFSLHADAGYGGSTRFPAIFANYEGTCIQPLTGNQKSISEWYVILALDELGGKTRCLKVAGKPAVSSVAQDCSFRKT